MANTATQQLFLNTYEESRQRFRNNISYLREYWPGATLEHHPLADHDDLSIDWIQAEARQKPNKRFILTTGQHGAEGHVGAAMLQLFIEEHLQQLNPDDTGVLFVHAINPWGMKHMRRVNPQNVDLNRNFVWDETDLNAAANPNYRFLNALLNPATSLRNLALAKFTFFLNLLKYMISPGRTILQSAMLMGQYAYPQGVYFGGERLQEETRTLMALYRQVIEEYDRILHLDMHTGYGPRYQMSLVNSPAEPRAPEALEQAFDYPQVVAATPDEFYTIQGDMIDWVYEWVRSEFPQKHLYATAFEFGTFGDSLLAGVRSMQAILFENQWYWHGAVSAAVKQRSKTEFGELFAPTERAWREKAVADALRAFDGILRDQGFL